MKRLHARAVKEMEVVTPAGVRKMVLGLFHRRHDYGDFDLLEVVAELHQLGISTLKQLRLLLKRHRRSILRDEKRKMSRAETVHLLSQFDSRGIDSHTNTAWFAVPGVVREALEKEFGWEVVKQFHEYEPEEGSDQEGTE
ncbi:hypothetical protein K7565_11150 [Stenotrophomonas maltophilia]|nr:hypothetical protein FEO91_12250 [Stenotrophomonas maltophilia]UXB14382.1 hypothetical protein K7565_11150 [Stenotrophomonas maltophilia]